MVVEFRFQNNSNREKACALDICVELKTKCSSEMSCGFTFFKNTTLATNHDHPLHGWGDEDGDTGELLAEIN